MKNPLGELVEQLSLLPGVGEKSAQRLAFFFLSLSKADVHRFSRVLSETREAIRYCELCFNISLAERCHICEDLERQHDVLCVVSEPKDVFSIERAGEFKGVYHVLGGLVSPLEGIHPEMLRVQELVDRLKQGRVSELIFAINSTVEGDTTILYLTQVLRPLGVKLSKLAYGLPMGADIDYTDELTLTKALQGRVELE